MCTARFRGKRNHGSRGIVIRIHGICTARFHGKRKPRVIHSPAIFHKRCSDENFGCCRRFFGRNGRCRLVFARKKSNLKDRLKLKWRLNNSGSLCQRRHKNTTDELLAIWQRKEMSAFQWGCGQKYQRYIVSYISAAPLGWGSGTHP